MNKKLTQVISNIVQCKETVEKHKFTEAATKQYIVIPILRCLGWDDSNLDTLEVYPEAKVNRKKVDYALQQGETPLVFIECKRWGKNIEKHQKQIRDYASSAEVEIAVITNGKLWDFYLPGQTSTSDRRVVPWQDRKFCSIDLELQQEAVSDFQKYLSKSNVEQGKAKSNAQEAFEPQTPDTPLPRGHYGLPILRALEELGGSGETHRVLERVFELMDAANQLRLIDKSRLSNGQFYWVNRTHNMRKGLIKEGLMKKDSSHGVWEISEKGRNHLLKVGKALSRGHYSLAILKALVELGGSGETHRVLERVFELMDAASQLQAIDKSRLPSGPVLWKSRAHNMRKGLIKKGLMKADSSHSVWEISEEGQNYLREQNP